MKKAFGIVTGPLDPGLVAVVYGLYEPVGAEHVDFEVEKVILNLLPGRYPDYDISHLVSGNTRRSRMLANRQEVVTRLFTSLNDPNYTLEIVG